MQNEDVLVPFISSGEYTETEKDRNDSFIYSSFEKNFNEEEDEEFSKLIEMGFEEKMILKVKVFLHPKTLEEAINLMMKEGEIYQHNFYIHKNSDKCYICGKEPEYHMDYDKNKFNPLFLIEQISRKRSKTMGPVVPKTGEKECIICNEPIPLSKLDKCILSCEHPFCEDCWLEYLSEKIKENKVQKITCMKNGCQTILGEAFILMHINNNEYLIEKYNKFKLRNEILNDPNKKFCPVPDCESYGEMTSSEKDNKNAKYITCKNGHKFCFNCLKEWHGKKKCQEEIDKDFKSWKKGKIVKQCPKCKFYTEKSTGCNHMTCAECGYQWCWLCRGKYDDGHFEFGGSCAGLQFNDNKCCQNCFCLYCYRLFTFLGTFIGFFFFNLLIFSMFYIITNTYEICRCPSRAIILILSVIISLAYGVAFQIFVTGLTSLLVVPIILYPSLLQKILGKLVSIIDY